jgi:hypothetical protein
MPSSTPRSVATDGDASAEDSGNRNLGAELREGALREARVGCVPNREHDMGTDMLVQARDDAGIDLGLLLGVQVKSGPSHFKEPYEGGGTLVGWWFREDEDHFNYWLNYQAAHIVVLHDQDTGICLLGPSGQTRLF